MLYLSWDLRNVSSIGYILACGLDCFEDLFEVSIPCVVACNCMELNLMIQIVPGISSNEGVRGPLSLPMFDVSKIWNILLQLAPI